MVEIVSIWFNYGGSNAIDLVDPASNVSLGSQPEWNSSGRNVPAAYVRGSQITLMVQFDRGHTLGLKVEVVGGGGDANFEYGGGSIVISLGSLGLPNAIAVNTVQLRWSSAYLDKDGVQWREFATTTHTVYTTWQRMVAKPSEGLTTTVYQPLMHWTCTWAARLDDAKAICDAVIGNLAKSGLKYGVAAWDVRAMLLSGGGMCGGWAKMFQYLLHCQGVFVYRRAYLVDWRVVGTSREVMWAAITIVTGGLNQVAPPVPQLTYRDDEVGFPIDAAVPLVQADAHRWIFWGALGKLFDGHVVNFLTYSGGLCLYDPSFGTGPFAINMPLPPDDGTILGGTQLASFKSVYLNKAVDYMMGCLRDERGVLRVASSGPPVSTGITVRTSVIPDVIATVDQITFGWVQG